jgi:hypothetical protein
MDFALLKIGCSRGMVAQAYNPIYLGSRDQEDNHSRPAQAESSMRLHFNPWQGMVMDTCHPSYIGSTNRRLTIQAISGIKPDPISKITKAKEGWEYGIKW